MRYGSFPLAIILLAIGSCKKYKDSNQIIGLYTESAPVPGRCQLNFITTELMTKRDSGSTIEDTFTYALTANSISLTPIWTSTSAPQSLDLEIIDNNTFKIENLYPAIPIKTTKEYITFRK